MEQKRTHAPFAGNKKSRTQKIPRYPFRYKYLRARTGACARAIEIISPPMRSAISYRQALPYSRYIIPSRAGKRFGTRSRHARYVNWHEAFGATTPLLAVHHEIGLSFPSSPLEGISFIRACWRIRVNDPQITREAARGARRVMLGNARFPSGMPAVEA